MNLMKTKFFLLLFCVLGLIACTNEDTSLPTLQPTLAPLASPVPNTIDTATGNASEATAISPKLEATGEAGSIETDVNRLVRDIQRSIKAADAFLKEFEKA